MIGEIESAIMAKLKAASESGYFGPAKLRGIESMSGKTPSEDDVKKALANAPCAWVSFLSASPTDNDFASQFESEAGFTVIMIDRHLGSGQQARQGTATTRGAYPLGEDAMRLLHGQQLGLDIAPLQCQAIRPIANDVIDGGQGSFVAVEFQTRYVVGLPSDAEIAAMANFETFHADWDIKPFIDPAPAAVPLATGAADATDTVILETLP
ncbi:MAG: DUF1834 family protein [Alphaproteobacteria bacterium]|nr:DUF1834 family protein [Alphaproteobacteria bacterium]